MNKYDKSVTKGRITTTRVRTNFTFIFLLAIFATLIVWPSSPGWFGNFKVHLGLDLQGGTHLVYQADVSDLNADEKRDGVEALRDVIERRVNVYGVSEPVVQTNFSGNNHRIIVELAGVKDVNEAIAIIDKTPLLDFRIQAEKPVEEEEVDEIKEKAQTLLDRVLAGEDFSEIANEFSEDPSSNTNGGELPWVARGEFVPEFDDVIFDELKEGEISPELVKSQFGYHIIKKLEERLAESGEIEVRAAHVLLQSKNTDLQWQAAGLSGKHVNKAQLNFQQTSQEPLVLLEFNDEGKDIFAQLTAENIGRPIGIFLDNELISSPIVQQEIRDGNAQITGNFTIDEAKELVKDLNLGALPVPIELISQQTVGASLGQVSVQKSLLAGIIGLIAAALFMILFYRLPGLISVIALAIYTVTTLAIFEMIPVTMTLAGVAGFILSVGMAVDANVLIFERTKEELNNGKSLNTAIENGFQRAWTSIRDSNVSSIITTIILAWFGTSIIKGFAITLGIGILISMFSAITVTRTLMRLLISRKVENHLGWFGIKNKT